MNIQQRQARAIRRAKSRNLVRKGVPFTPSKFGYMSPWAPPMSAAPGLRMTLRSYQSWRKRARFDFRKSHGEPLVRLRSENA